MYGIKYSQNTSELARTLLFPVESTNKKNYSNSPAHQRVVGERCNWEGIPLMNAC